MRAGCLVLTILAVASGCRKAETHIRPTTPVKTQSVEMLSTSDELRYSANVEPHTQVPLAFKAGGYVDRIHRVRGIDGTERDVQDGDIVAAGTVLAQVRRTEYTAKSDQAKSQVAEAESSLLASKAQLTEAEAGLRQAELDYTRAKNLCDTQSLTRAELDGANTKLDASRARVDAAKNQIAAIQARMRGAQAMLAEAGIALEDTSLRAPMNGVVLKKMIEAGSLVSPGTAAFVLADTRSVKVVFGVPDTVVPRLKLGLGLPVGTEALPDAEFSGRITRISPSADLKSRVFEVEVTVPNPANRLRAGMIASVVLRGGAAGKKVPVVPLSAIVRSCSKAGEYAVFIVRREGDKEVARMRDVRLGETFGNAIAVRSGVEPGERIITNGSPLVRDGEPVVVVP